MNIKFGWLVENAISIEFAFCTTICCGQYSLTNELALSENVNDMAPKAQLVLSYN